jgi:hypothetical protein
MMLSEGCAGQETEKGLAVTVTLNLLTGICSAFVARKCQFA